MPIIREAVQITYVGSPTLSLFSHGSGTQNFTLRVTNNEDQAGGRKFIIRNERFINEDRSRGRDLLVIDHRGNIDVGPGDIRVSGADCAEEFDATVADVEPGSVMVLSADGELHQSSECYDRKVVGVVSGGGLYRAGIVLGRKNDFPGKRVLIALAGKVFCKVDADEAPIQVGDLLTTSSTVGHAMTAVDPSKSFGAVIGKALRPLAKGRGLIPVLVTLQ